MQVPDKLGKVHFDLISAMEKIKEDLTLTSARESNSEEIFNQINADLQNMIEDMESHLTEEGEEIPELLRNNSTKEDHDAVISNIVKNTGLNGLVNILPLISDALEKTGGYGSTTIESF